MDIENSHVTDTLTLTSHLTDYQRVSGPSFFACKTWETMYSIMEKRWNPVREFPPVGSPSVLKGGHSTSQLVHLVIAEKSPKWDIPYVFVTFVVTCRNHCQLWWTSSAPICRLFHESEAGCRRFAWSLRSPLPKKVAIMVIWRSGSYLGAKNNHEFGWLMLRLIYTVYTWHTQDTHKYQFLCGWAFLWLDWVLSQQLRMHESISAKKTACNNWNRVSKPVGPLGSVGLISGDPGKNFPTTRFQVMQERTGIETLTFSHGAQAAYVITECNSCNLLTSSANKLQILPKHPEKKENGFQTPKKRISNPAVPTSTGCAETARPGFPHFWRPGTGRWPENVENCW